MAKKTAKKTTKHKSTGATKKSTSKKKTAVAPKGVTKTSKKDLHKDPAIWIVGILILIAIIAAIVTTTSSEGSGSSDVVTLVEYTDYGCPYCSKAYATVERLKEEYGDSLEVIHKNFPIVSLHPTAPKAHEAAECAKDQGKFSEYRAWLFGNQRSHDLNNLRKAASDLSLDLAKFNMCLDNGDKTSIVTADMNEGRSKGVSGTPAFFINGESLVGAQPIDKFRSVIDKALNSNGTAAATEEQEVEIILLTDNRCSDCDDLQYAKSILAEQMSKATIKTIDYSSPEGLALYSKYDLNYIPAVLFGKEIETYDIYLELQSNLADVEDYYYLPVQPHDPTAEICNNGIDDTANGLIDCEDDSCSETLECRPELDANVKLYIMSDCPYGTKAIEALKPISDLFGSQLDYEVHYIASELADGSIKSLHGQYEVDEDVVQLCVEQESPASHIDYLYCRSTNGIRGVDWKTCAAETGVNVDAVEVCFNNEGVDLLKADILEASALGVSGSPTWLINNRYQTGGFDSETIKNYICKYNDLDGCDTTLTSSAGDVPAGSCN